MYHVKFKMTFYNLITIWRLRSVSRLFSVPMVIQESVQHRLGEAPKDDQSWRAIFRALCTSRMGARNKIRDCAPHQQLLLLCSV